MSAYLSAVLADAPLHYWRMADPGGAIAYDIGSAPNQLYSFGQTQPGYRGPVNDGLSGYFNNGPYYRTFRGFPQNPPYTLECWVFVVQNPNDQVAAYGNISLGVRADMTPLITTPGSALVTPAPVLSLEHWHHLVGQVDAAGNRRTYADGALAASDVHAVANATQPYTIGSQNGGAFFSGFICEVAWYTFILSAARIAAHYAAADLPNSQPSYQLTGLFPNAAQGVSTLTSLSTTLTDSVTKDLRNTP